MLTSISAGKWTIMTTNNQRTTASLFAYDSRQREIVWFFHLKKLKEKKRIKIDL